MKVLLVLSAILAVAFKGAGSLPHVYGPVGVAPYIPSIINGKITTIEEHPHQISLRYLGEHICGGSILDKYTILTAAHCVHGKDHSLFSVRAGSTIHSEGIEIEVAHIIEHENYVPAFTINDMAIIKLRKPLEFNSHIKPIELQPADTPVEVGVKAEVTGWGMTEQGLRTLPDKLRVSTVYVVSNAQCANSYQGEGVITRAMLCAQVPNRKDDACFGDSGGPLTAQGKLIGVVSWGNDNCGDVPVVYANVSTLHDWAFSLLTKN